jgi:hypothetical protein
MPSEGASGQSPWLLVPWLHQAQRRPKAVRRSPPPAGTGEAAATPGKAAREAARAKGGGCLRSALT